MSNQRDGSIEITQLRESDTEYGAKHDEERLLHPTDEEKTPFFPNWENKIFIISCAFAVLLSPLFCYIPIIIEDNLCFQWDVGLMIIFIALQVFLDLFYALDIFVFSWRIIRDKHKTNKMVKQPRLLQWLPIIPRIYMFLPISQAVVLIGYFGTYGMHNLYEVILVIFYPIQYTLRAYCTFRLIKQRRLVKSRIERWFQTVLDYLPFIIASHLFGALWYNFAVGRETDCWYKASSSYQFTCTKRFNVTFYCDSDKNITAQLFRTCNMTHIKASCPIEPADDKKFDFGIYNHALRSNLTRSSYLPRKLLQSFWWGLKNLSSFGSNLEPSFYTLELCFCILTSISGLALFIIYINTMLQVSDKRYMDKDNMHSLLNRTNDALINLTSEVRNLQRHPPGFGAPGPSIAIVEEAAQEDSSASMDSEEYQDALVEFTQ
ncbi:hypothetical protein ABKV19_026695 [Rosa sericea]